MNVKTVLLGFGGAFILYFIASVLNMISLRIEDSGKEYPIVENVLGVFVVILYIFSLPVSVPCFLMDSFHSRRALKRHDSAMLEAAARYYKKCISCPACDDFKRERPDFGYDKDNLRFLPYEPEVTP